MSQTIVAASSSLLYTHTHTHTHTQQPVDEPRVRVQPQSLLHSLSAAVHLESTSYVPAKKTLPSHGSVPNKSLPPACFGGQKICIHHPPPVSAPVRRRARCQIHPCKLSKKCHMRRRHLWETVRRQSTIILLARQLAHAGVPKNAGPRRSWRGRSNNEESA